MKVHDWSTRVTVYESIDMIACRGCGAVILAADPEGNLDNDCTAASLPLNCDEALPAVVHEDYSEWNDGPWNDDDVPEWGEWGIAFSREGSKHFPIPLWCLSKYHIPERVLLLSKDKYSTYMHAWHRCQELNRS